MLKRIGIVMAAAVLGVVALTVPASTQPQPRFTLQIDPKEGKVGTNIQAQLPDEAFKPGGECLSKNQIVEAIQKGVAGIISSGSIDPQQPRGSSLGSHEYHRDPNPRCK